jgi:single-strand DNA-binding protein
MSSLNKVFLMGNLTRDPEVRYTPKGTAVTDLAIAINRTYKGQDGQEREEVTYVDIVTWGRQAETCGQYLSKGSPVFVEGRLQLDQWEDSEGKKKSRLRVLAERVQFLGRPKTGETPRDGGAPAGPGASAPGKSRPPAPSQPQSADDVPPVEDDDIPF